MIESSAQEPAAARELEATHEQTKVIRVVDTEHQSAKLTSFGVDQQGSLLTAVTSGVLRFSSDRDLLESHSLDFSPEAIRQSSDGTIFVGGAGKLAKRSASWNPFHFPSPRNPGPLTTLPMDNNPSQFRLF